jgi:hypothetical protein
MRCAGSPSLSSIRSSHFGASDHPVSPTGLQLNSLGTSGDNNRDADRMTNLVRRVAVY